MQLRLIALIGIMAFLVSFVSFAAPGNAQAALTLNNFVGFETNGLDETLGSNGTPTFSTSPLKTGDCSLDLGVSGSNQVDLAMITGGSTDSDNDFILGFWFHPEEVTGGSDVILTAFDDTPGEIWQLGKAADEISIRDANTANVVTTTTDVFTVDTWHFIEIRWQHSATAAVDVHVDGVSEISETGYDMTDGGAISEDLAFYQLTGGGGGGSLGQLFDDFYAYSGGTGTGDFLGNAEVFRYQGCRDPGNDGCDNSATPNTDCAVAAAIGDLDQGVWQDLGETPRSSDVTEPGYTDGGSASGAIWTDSVQSGDNFRPGPNGDSNIDGDSNIKGGKWLSYIKRGTGSTTSHNFCHGTSNEAPPHTGVTLTTESQIFTHISVAANELPTSSEYFAIGFYKGTGGREPLFEEMWGMILHVPDDGAARRIFPVQ